MTTEDLSQIKIIIEEALDAKLEEKLESKLESKLNSKLDQKLTNLESKLDAKFEEKLKPIHKKLNKLQKDMNLIARSTDRDITRTMHRVTKIESHLGLRNPFSL